MTNVMSILCMFLLLLLACGKTNSLVINVPGLGQVEGHYLKTFKGRSIYAFEGVPYAEPPIGENRFQAPVPVKPWNGIRNATTKRRCLQYNQYSLPGEDRVIGDEDCLYINLFTPTLEQENMDVVVYIHGGSFMFNYAGLYQPDYLLDRDIVLITFNYRLGPLGFLSTEDDVVPGNNGMKDQILALQFVKKYVQYFGGNSNSITLLGNSAGGVSVHFHYLSLKSRFLFNQGWSQSGTTLVPWAFMENALEKTQKIADNVGCTKRNNKEMIDCLRAVPARDIVGSVKIFQPWLYLPFSPFGLVVDSWSSDPVLPQHPYEILNKKLIYDVPWIASYTNAEGLYPTEEFYDKLDTIEERWYELAPLILDYNFTVDDALKVSVSKDIKRYYCGDEKLSLKNIVPMLSDRLFVNGIQKAARMQAAGTTSPVLSYRFSYRGKNSWFNVSSDLGAAHADDIPYILKLSSLDTSSNEYDRAMSTFLIDILVSYASTGKPNFEWPEVPKSINDVFTFLDISSPGNVFTEMENTIERSRFWNSLPVKENKLFNHTKDEL